MYETRQKTCSTKCEIKRCVKCKRTVRSKPAVLPKNKYGNNLVSTSAIMHYLHGIPMKRIEEIWGKNVVAGNLIKIFHRLAAYWKPALEQLKDEYRRHPVKKEIQTFVSCLAPLLAQVMHLQAKPIADQHYYQQALTLQRKIRACIRSPAEHPAIQTYQDIFRINNKRLYHWVTDRRVPAHNNPAERELRPTVIARKVSFGSHISNGGSHALSADEYYSYSC